MKKTLTILFAAVILLSLIGCGGRKTVSDEELQAAIEDYIEQKEEEKETEEKTAEPAVVGKENSEDAAESAPAAEEPEEILPEATEEPEAPVEDVSETSSGLRPEFKEAMDAYEAFYDEYCAFMTQFNENPTDLTLLLSYGEMLIQVEEMNAAFEAWDESDLNDAELTYYLEVNNRVMQKMLNTVG